MSQQKPPYGLTLRKGCKNVVLTRSFASYVLNEWIAIDLINFLQTTQVPDEHFYSTLATVKSYNPKVKQLCNLTSTKLRMDFLEYDLSPRFKRELLPRTWWMPGWSFTWDWDHSKYKEHNCTGQTIRSICNFGTADLPEMWAEAAAERCMTANKFNLDVDPVAVICHAKHVVHLTRDVY